MREEIVVLDVMTLKSYGLVVAAGEGGAVSNTYAGTSNHYKVGAAQLRGHKIEAGSYGPASKKLSIIAGSDTVYLPFWQNNISSVELPSSGPTVFVTDNM